MRQEVLPGPERRRRWSWAEKQHILAEAASPEVSVAEVARRYDVSRTLIYRWRRELAQQGLVPDKPARFLPVELDSSLGEGGLAGPGGEVEIGLRGGRHLRLDADTPEAVVVRFIRMVEGA